MPGNCEFNKKEAEKFISNGGVSERTKYQRERAQNHFIEYAKSKIGDQSFENGTFFEDITQLESVLIHYFSTFRKLNDDLPKKNYLDSTKSHINVLIKNKTKSMVDINESSQFPNFAGFYKGKFTRKNLKKKCLTYFFKRFTRKTEATWKK